MLVRRTGQPWGPPDSLRYDDEAALQQLIAESPSLVTREGARPAVALREFTIPAAGSLDVLLVHTDGQLTLVEAKLNRNAEIRRAVVGQLLGYAGGLWQMTYEQLDLQVRSRIGKPLAALAAELDDGEFDENLFREAVGNNLRSGTFRLVFGVDEITDDLRRAVEFLNASTTDRLEVVVLQLEYARVGDVEILQPRVFGEEAASRKQNARARRAWTEDDFFATLASEASGERVATVRKLLDWARPRVKRFYWGEGQSPSCTLVFDTAEGPIQPLSFWTGTYSGFSINFEWIRKRPVHVVEQFFEQVSSISQIAGMRDELVAAAYAKRPTLSLDMLDDERIAILTNAIEQLIATPANEEDQRTASPS